MHDNDLDTFPQEGEPTATKMIVITDEEITSSWDAFPTEEADAQPPSDPTASATYAPPSRLSRPIARAATSGRRRFASAALVLAFGVGLFAGQAIMRRFVTPPEVAREVAVQTPTLVATPSPAESRNAPPVIAQGPDAGRPEKIIRAGRPMAQVQDASRPARAPARPTRPERNTRIATVAASAVRPPVPPRSTVAPPLTVAKPLTAAASPASPLATSGAATPPPPIATAVAMATPAPGSAATTTAAAVVTPPAAVAQAPETNTVLGTLHRYEEAFSTLNSSAAQQVWPDVDVRALDRAFNQLAQQTFDLRACDVGVTGERAEAMCTGTTSYARKVGNKAMRVESRRWRFTLRRNSGEWLIERVDVR